jgi:Fibrobacter succinogenes major domain (Fib_succ_major).
MKKKIRIRLLPVVTMGFLLMLTNSCKKDEVMTCTDADGYTYKTVTIGNQVWMAENLKTTKYNNGDLIGTTTPDTLDILVEASPKYQWAYGGNESNVATYGRLYTWYAVTDSRNVCPTGWHVPSDAEWHTLVLYLDPSASLSDQAESWIADDKLKESGTVHWQSPNSGATNETGFTALPGGIRNYEGPFYLIGSIGEWWSSTEVSTSLAWGRHMYYENNSAVVRSDYYEQLGFSIRCLKDN